MPLESDLKAFNAAKTHNNFRQTKMNIYKSTSIVVLSLLAAILATCQASLVAKENKSEVASPTGRSEVQGKKVPPDQWWGDPCWSPDNAYLAVQSPPPGRASYKGTDGTTTFGYKQVPERNIAILRSTDYSLLYSIGAIRPEWSPNRKFLAAIICPNLRFTMQLGSPITVFDGATGVQVCRINAGHPPFTSFAWSPDGGRLLVIERAWISIHDINEKLETKIKAQADENMFREPTWSPDGKSVAAVGSKNGDESQAIIRIWNAQSGSEVTKIEVKGKVGAISWSLDGRSFLYSQLGSIDCLDLASNKITRSIKTRERVRFSWSPKKKQLVYKDCDSIHLLDAQTLNENTTIQGQKNGSFGFALSPDEKFLAINGIETIALCNGKTGTYLGYKTLKDISSVRWAPDGKSLTVGRNFFSTIFEPVRLPTAQKNETVFYGGKDGAPDLNISASPKNLEECFAVFDRQLSNKERERFKNTPEVWLCKFGGGSFTTDSLISDKYNTWGTGELDRFFEEYGITDPRDVNGIVVESYWCHLNSRPIEFELQVRRSKAYWDLQNAVIKENRQLQPSFLNLQATDSKTGLFSIGSAKGKLKIVSFIDSDTESSAAHLDSLKELRVRYPSKEVAFMVFVIPAKSLTRKTWQGQVVSAANEKSWSANEIAAFPAEAHDGILVAKASEAMCKELFKFEDLVKYSAFSPPQTWVMTSKGLVKMRLNGAHKNDVESALENELKAARFRRNCTNL